MAKLKKQKRHTYDPAPSVIFDGNTVNTQRYDDVYYVHRVGAVTGINAVRWFSRPVHSTTLPFLRALGLAERKDILFRLSRQAIRPGKDKPSLATAVIATHQTKLLCLVS